MPLPRTERKIALTIHVPESTYDYLVANGPVLRHFDRWLAPTNQAEQHAFEHAAHALESVIQATNTVDVEAGMRYAYTSGHSYEVVEVFDDEVLLLRLGVPQLNTCQTQPGTRLIERLDKVERDLLSGDAQLL